MSSYPDLEVNFDDEEKPTNIAIGILWDKVNNVLNCTKNVDDGSYFSKTSNK